MIVIVVSWVYMYRASQTPPTNTIVATIVTWTIATGDMVNTGQILPSSSSVSYVLVSNSLLWRKASKATGFHTGTVNITSGMITRDPVTRTIFSGMFVMTMDSVKVLDIQDTWFESKIANDFFEANSYPQSILTIKGSVLSGTQLVIMADLTIKNKTHLISFPATVVTTDNNIIVSSSFAIDRMIRGLDMRKGMVNDYLEYNLQLTFNS